MRSFLEKALRGSLGESSGWGACVVFGWSDGIAALIVAGEKRICQEMHMFVWVIFFGNDLSFMI